LSSGTGILLLSI